MDLGDCFDLCRGLWVNPFSVFCHVPLIYLSMSTLKCFPPPSNCNWDYLGIWPWTFPGCGCTWKGSETSETMPSPGVTSMGLASDVFFESPADWVPTMPCDGFLFLGCYILYFLHWITDAFWTRSWLARWYSFLHASFTEAQPLSCWGFGQRSTDDWNIWANYSSFEELSPTRSERCSHRQSYDYTAKGR